MGKGLFGICEKKEEAKGGGWQEARERKLKGLESAPLFSLFFSLLDWVLARRIYFFVLCVFFKLPLLS